MNTRNFWINMFLALGFSIVTTFMYLIFTAITSDHKIRIYYLESYYHSYSVGDHELRIISDRDWGIDGSITLDRSVTYEQAIEIVAKMNKKLKR